MDKCDVTILGAGPYGMSAAAHLGQVKGLDVKLFGEPMSFWERYMPEAMILKSPWEGSHLADPENRYNLNRFQTLNGNGLLAEPIPRRDFVKYGHWFYEQARLSADRRKVTRIDAVPKGYQLFLDDGETIVTRRVVVAAGIQPFAHRPEMFLGFPSELVTHSSEHRDFAKFRGKEVLVIGAGQSALESAALLSESGAHAEVLVRNSVVHWQGRQQLIRSMGIGWLFYGRGGVGHAGVSLLIQRPDHYRRLPRPLQDRWAKRAIRPAGAPWLRPRVQNITIRTEQYLNRIRIDRGRLNVRLNDGTDRVVDHLILGTGYHVDIALYSFLSPALLRTIDVVNGYPRLDAGFECTSPGLHFLGAPAAWSFGPLMKFVAGTEFASRALASRILQAKSRQIAPHALKGYQLEPLKLETKVYKAE